MNEIKLKLFFSDHFNVQKKELDQYGAFDISLLADTPLFIDPFLIFHASNNDIYQTLHKEIIKYLTFLRDSAESHRNESGALKYLYCFGEVKQNWLGFSRIGNGGRGLGLNFATKLNDNLGKFLVESGISKSVHIEKLCLIEPNVGRDMISDFTTNLIKWYLLKYTQTFALEHIENRFCKSVNVRRVRFNYETEAWESGQFVLPFYNGDYILLTPKDILTREDNWINRSDLFGEVDEILAIADDNGELRFKLERYLKRVLPVERELKPKDYREAKIAAIYEFPELIDYFIKYKESNGDTATQISSDRVAYTEIVYIDNVKSLVSFFVKDKTLFSLKKGSYVETKSRLEYFIHTIENRGLWKNFYHKDEPIKDEKMIQRLFDLVWYGTPYDVSREADTGLGNLDYKISMGKDKTIVEFKLASNTQLKKNLMNQIEMYKKAEKARNGIHVIAFFNDYELSKVDNVLNELKIPREDIFIIDLRPKITASKV